MSRLEDSIEIGGLEIPNRLYRAPLLECAGNNADTVDTLIDELEPAAESGVGLIFQGATIVREEGGCAAPKMTRVHDPDFVSQLDRLTEAVNRHGTKIFPQLEHGGLRSMETWHAGYRDENPGLEQLAVSKPPQLLRIMDKTGFLDYNPYVLSTDEVHELAADFGKSARYLVEAGYDGIHLAGANMGIIQQFLSPFYNRRDDEFGGSLDERVRFLELVHDEIRERVGDIPLVTKVPAEVEAPLLARPTLSMDDGIETTKKLEEIGYDAVVPVKCSVFWDASIVRGEYPKQAWKDTKFESGYSEAFGSRWRAKLVSFLNRVESLKYSFEPSWNEDFCAEVKEKVSIPVLAEGGIRERGNIDRLLAERRCDMVGMGRPFYAEPRLGARILNSDPSSDSLDEGVRVLCESCNNCTVPQVTGADGVCRTPNILEKRGELERRNAYESDS